MSGGVKPYPSPNHLCSQKCERKESFEHDECPKIENDFEDILYDNQSSYSISQSDHDEDDLGRSIDDFVSGSANDNNIDSFGTTTEQAAQEGGGGRNGGRSNMGEVMASNDHNDGNEIDYGNEYVYRNDDPNDNSNFYEDNSNFGDVGLQIVVNGNDADFFV